MPKTSSKRAHKKRSKTLYDHAVFVMNTKATNGVRAKKLWKEIERAIGIEKSEVVNIAKLTPTESVKAVTTALKSCTSRSILCVGGGDGTVSMVIKTLVLSKDLSQDNKRALLLPLWGGNANDMAVMLNGLPSTASIKKILQSSKPTEIYPLKIVLTPPEKKAQVFIAGCYASFGATAEALARMELSSHVRGHSGPKHKITRFVHEFRDIGKTFFDVRPIKVAPDQAKTVELYDRIFVNGSRYAKILRSPVDLHERRYFVLSSREKKWWYFMLRTLRPLATKAGGTISDKQRSFTLKDSTYMQVDGEVFPIQADTHMQVSIASDPFYALSTKLQG